MNAADALDVHQYRHKHHWLAINDEVVDETQEGIEMVEQSEDWNRIRALFRRIEPDEQRALQLVVIDGVSLRKTARQLGVSAMTVQRRVKRGLHRLAEGLKEDQAGV